MVFYISTSVTLVLRPDLLEICILVSPQINEDMKLDIQNYDECDLNRTYHWKNLWCNLVFWEKICCAIRLCKQELFGCVETQ